MVKLVAALFLYASICFSKKIFKRRNANKQGFKQIPLLDRKHTVNFRNDYIYLYSSTQVFCPSLVSTGIKNPRNKKMDVPKEVFLGPLHPICYCSLAYYIDLWLGMSAFISFPYISLICITLLPYCRIWQPADKKTSVISSDGSFFPFCKCKEVLSLMC